MQRYATLATLTIMVIALLTLTVSAQIPLNMSYQARLADSTGNPVPDGPYDIELLFYADSTGGSPVWSEQFFGVNTSNGFLSVMTEPIDLGALGGPLFMEVTVGGEILSPRSRMASVPYSAISHRVQGDIITNEGLMYLTNADGDSCIEMSGDGVQSSFKMMDPVDKKDAFELLTAQTGNFLTIFDPADDELSAFEFTADNLNTRYSLNILDPVDGTHALDLIADGVNRTHRIKMIDPANNNAPAIDLCAGDSSSGIKVDLISVIDHHMPGVEITATESGYAGNEASIKIFNPQPNPPADNPIILMNTGGSDLGSIKMFNPQPEPPAVLMEMNSSPSTGANIKMFNPQPEPPAVFLEMNTDQYGANFAMTAPQAGIGPGDEITDPLLEAIADSSGGAINLYNEISKYMGVEPVPFTPGGRLRMYNPVADAVKFEVETTADGASIDIYDEIGKYMGLEPTPFTPGGLLQMYDPVADAVKFEVSTTEDGTGIDIYDEIGKYMGLDPSPFEPGGYLHMIESTGFVVDTNITLGSDGYIHAENGVTIGSNTNTGNHTLVMGAETAASGDNSFAGGMEAQANHDHCFVWSDNPFGPSMVTLQTSNENQFLVRSTGTIAFYTNMNLTYGVSLGPGDYAWNSIVPPPTLRNSRDVDGAEILNKIEQLPVKRFNTNDETEHISPSPEDFNRLFDTGTAENQISMQDQSGIALAGIKEMINIINELKDKNAELERRIAELERTR